MIQELKSHPTRVRGLKFLQVIQLELKQNVAPYAGAWIEIVMSLVGFAFTLSHPTRVRGLKSQLKQQERISLKVAPYAGAWIEIIDCPAAKYCTLVAPYAGAWIEIFT